MYVCMYVCNAMNAYLRLLVSYPFLCDNHQGSYTALSLLQTHQVR